MAVKLNSTGGGSVTLDSPSTASNYTVTLPAATSTLIDTTSTQTLTNKTIASLVTTGTATFGGIVDTGSTGQVKFPATQNPSSDANTLDDYEEGTWTPVFTCTSGTLTVSNTYGAARYTKVGRIVTLYTNLIISAASSPSGALTLSGLPFAQGGSYAGASAASFYIYSAASALGSQPVMASTSPGSPTMAINVLASGSAGAAAGYMQVGTQLYMQVTYSE